MNANRSESPDVVERIGIVIWKVAILVIGLQLILELIPQQALLDGLVTGSALLHGSALILITLGIGWTIASYLRARGSWPTRPTPAAQLRSRQQSSSTIQAYWRNATAHSIQQIMWRGSNWMVALGLEGMLAAQIIRVSIANAGRNELDWWRMGVVAVIAIGRILI